MHFPQTLCLDPQNPRYFLFRGKTTVLVAATEHYGAVSNKGFEYEAYLTMLAENGLNLTRLVLTIREQPTEFKSALGYQNTCCPTLENSLTPWARSDKPGCADGGNLFDLDRWDEAFFSRLAAFCALAGRLDIAVEVTFFSQLYSDKPDGPWPYCPLNPGNNVQGEGAAAFNRYTTCENPELLARQEALVRRVVRTLADSDNVYYEICNEPPYPQAEDGDEWKRPEHAHALGEEAVSIWQNHLAEVIRREEDAMGRRHMIAVGDPQETIRFELFSVLNYHYRQWMESGLRRHGGLGKAMALDETLTGIVSWNREMDFDARRYEAWEFFMRGAAVYDYLDFTIATDDPHGEASAEYPGGHRFDGRAMRRYLRVLSDFFQGLDLKRMRPDGEADAGKALIWRLSESAKAWALTDGDGGFAAYIRGYGVADIGIRLPEGMYAVEWIDPPSAEVLLRERRMGGEGAVWEIPEHGGDLAVRGHRVTEPNRNANEPQHP